MSLYLAKGQRSNEIAALQNALNKAGASEPLILDGIFGPLTDGAVHQFQKQQGLTSDGIAGPLTLGALFEGLGVRTRVTVAARSHEPRAAAMPAAAAAPAPEPPRPISFGTIGLFSRELRVSNWLFEDFPKSPLGAPPTIPFGASPDLAAVRLRGIPIDRLSLMPGQRRIEARGSARHGFGCELEVKSTTSDFKEVEYEFEFKCVQPKFDGFFKPGAALKPSPDGGWAAELSIDVTPFHILDHDWKRFSVGLNPLVSGSMTVPFMRGVDPTAVEIFGGLEGEITFRPSLKAREFELFLGGKGGATGSLNFRNGRFQGAALAPGLQGTFGLRVRF